MVTAAHAELGSTLVRVVETRGHEARLREGVLSRHGHGSTTTLRELGSFDERLRSRREPC